MTNTTSNMSQSIQPITPPASSSSSSANPSSVTPMAVESSHAETSPLSSPDSSSSKRVESSPKRFKACEIDEEENAAVAAAAAAEAAKYEAMQPRLKKFLKAYQLSAQNSISGPTQADLDSTSSPPASIAPTPQQSAQQQTRDHNSPSKYIYIYFFYRK